VWHSRVKTDLFQALPAYPVEKIGFNLMVVDYVTVGQL
jgi:hypothetical protein